MGDIFSLFVRQLFEFFDRAGPYLFLFNLLYCVICFLKWRR